MTDTSYQHFDHPEDPGFYKQPNIAERLEKLAVNSYQVSSVKTEKIESGFLDTAGLRKITLLDSSEKSLENLLAKKYSEDRRKRSVHITVPNKSVEDETAYRFANLKFQNDIGVLSPLVLYRGIYKDVTHGRKGEIEHLLLLDYWDGPSADMNVIACRRAIESRMESLRNDKFLSDNEKTNFNDEVRKLYEIMKNEIVLKILDSMADFSHRAMQHDIIKSGDCKLEYDGGKKMNIDRVKNSFDFLIGKRENQFKALVYWNLIDGQQASKDEVLNEDKRLKNLANKKWNNFKSLFQPLRENMFLKGTDVYSQGDQHLHHFKRRPLRQGADENVRMGIFDMGSAKMEDPLFGSSRLLSSYLLDFNREKIRDIFKERYLGFVSEYKDDVQNKENKIELAFELCTLLENIWAFSRRAHDIIYNRPEYDRQTYKFREKRKLYDNQVLPLVRNIQLPEEIGLDLYDASATIKTNKLRIQEIIQGLIVDTPNYYCESNLVDPLKRLQEFIEDTIIEIKKEAA